MGQSLVKNYLHIVFSTHARLPFLVPSVRDELFNYIGGTCNHLKCQSLNVGGYVEHVHILCMLNKNITLADLVGKVKSSSSKWLKTKGSSYKTFKWQEGYSAFSVSESIVPITRKYIENQEAHHSVKKMDFKDELIQLLIENDVEYDERYLWR